MCLHDTICIASITSRLINVNKDPGLKKLEIQSTQGNFYSKICVFYQWPF